MQFDLVLKGGHLIDPQNGIDAPKDIGIEGKTIAAVDADLPTKGAGQVIDVSGLYVTPGLVDIHVHAYATAGHRDTWAGDNSILPDGFSFRTGVTTLVDTGSAGWRNFEDFRHRVIDRCQTRLFALVNIAGTGMTSIDHEQNPYDMDPDKTAGVARENEDVVVGIKTAHYIGPEWISVDRTLAAAEKAATRVMIDFGYFRKERPYYQLLGEKLRSGDISTHIFRGPTPWFDAEGKVLPYLHEARARGVVLDVGHGAGSFCFRNAGPCHRPRLLSRLDLDRPARPLHEYGYARHGDDHGKISGDGHAARRGYPRLNHQSGAGDWPPRTGAPVSGGRGRCGSLEADGGGFWVRGFFWRSVGRPQAAALRADGQGGRSGLGLEWPSRDRVSRTRRQLWDPRRRVSDRAPGVKRKILVKIVSALLLVIVGCGQEHTGDPIVVRDAWIREPPPRSPAAGYLVIENRGGKPVELVAVATEAAEQTEIHIMEYKDDRMTMRPAAGIQVPAGGRLR